MITKATITKIAQSYGYKKTRDKNGSFYYENSQFINEKLRTDRIRFSDHFLGQNSWGQTQTAGATCDIVEWDKDITAEKCELIFRFPEIGEDIQCTNDVADYIENEGGIEELQQYYVEYSKINQ